MDAAPWRFAKTMAHIPHWYVVRGKTVAADDFDEFVALLAEQGFRAIWTSPGGRRYENTYIEIGKWKYWRIDDVLNRDLRTSSHVERVGTGCAGAAERHPQPLAT